MNQITKLQKWLALGIATACMVVGLNSLPAVQAQTPVAPSGFTPAKDAATVQLTLPSAPTSQTLDTPQEPSGLRGIICKEGQSWPDCDDRVPMTDTRQPWSAIGRIVMTDSKSGRYQCTGTLIADSLILTNAHCIVNPDTHQAYASLSFEPNLVDGILADSQDRAKIIGGVYGTDFRDQAKPPHPNDWAIAKLDKPLGQKYGAIGVQAVSLEVFSSNPDKLTLVGYSFDFPDPSKFKNLTAGAGKTPGMHEKCSVVSELTNSVLVHDCDMRGGASGGPILGWIEGKPYIVGINSSELANPVSGLGRENYATNVARVIEWVQKQQQ